MPVGIKVVGHEGQVQIDSSFRGMHLIKKINLPQGITRWWDYSGQKYTGNARVAFRPLFKSANTNNEDNFFRPWFLVGRGWLGYIENEPPINTTLSVDITFNNFKQATSVDLFIYDVQEQPPEHMIGFSVFNEHGKCVYDTASKYMKVKEYFTGIQDLAEGASVDTSNIITNELVVNGDVAICPTSEGAHFYNIGAWTDSMGNVHYEYADGRTWYRITSDGICQSRMCYEENELFYAINNVASRRFSAMILNV